MPSAAVVIDTDRLLIRLSDARARVVKAEEEGKSPEFLAHVRASVERAESAVRAAHDAGYL